MFKTINDASHTSRVNLDLGTTEVWFCKPEFKNVVDIDSINRRNLAETHVKVGNVAEKDPSSLFWALQAEIYSPNNEAKPMLKALGLNVQSVSIADVFVINGKVHIVKSVGFKQV